MHEGLNYEKVWVHPLKGGWKTTINIMYKDLFIAKGFFTNGANIPRLLWRLIPPNDPEVFPSVVVHDYLCYKMQYIKADNYLEEILIASDVVKWKRKSFIYGVRSYTKVGRPIEKKIKSLWRRIF